jgi:1,4-alpha-glucan branching enzyme
VCLYWIDNFKIDGIRFDNTVNFYIPGNTEGLIQLLQDIQDYLDKIGEVNFSLTLEHISTGAADVTNQSKLPATGTTLSMSCALIICGRDRSTLVF